jgi:hypothetical protein
MGAAVAEFFGALWARWKARRAALALSDLEKGKAILDQAQREADEMERARRELDAGLSGTPVVNVPAAPAPAMPATLPPAKP